MQSIEVKKTARYATWGNENSPFLLIALHGYGQLVEYFIKNFESLDPQQFYVVAPEGLNRFYLNGTSGRVGASWMTKEWRSQDNLDNIKYLDELVKQVTSKNTYQKIIFFGFSQGVPTCMRFAAHMNFTMDQIILWGSNFPEDVQINPSIAKKIVVFLGDNDPYMPPETLTRLIKEYRSLGIEPTIYQGEHRIVREFLRGNFTIY